MKRRVASTNILTISPKRYYFARESVKKLRRLFLIQSNRLINPPILLPIIMSLAHNLEAAISLLFFSISTLSIPPFSLAAMPLSAPFFRQETGATA